LGGVHDLYADVEGVWICCTNADLMIKIDWEGRIIADWEWRQFEPLRSAFGLHFLPPLDRTLDYRDPQTMRSGLGNIAHLNSLFPAPDGGLLLSFGRVLSPARYRRARFEGWLGRVARIAGVDKSRGNRSRIMGQPIGRIAGSSSAIVWMRMDGSPEILIHERGLEVPNHNVWLANRTLFYNDSNSACLIGRSWQDQTTKIQVAIPGSFLRGLTQLDDNTFLVGSNTPASVHRVDLPTAAVTESIQLSSDPREAVFALCLLANTFDDPPPQWPEAIWSTADLLSNSPLAFKLGGSARHAPLI
jgi:hypothetical protein